MADYSYQIVGKPIKIRHLVNNDRSLENIYDYSDIRGDAKFEIMIDITCDYKLSEVKNYFK